MQIVKDTKAAVGYLVSQVRPPKPSLTLVVKVTYAINEGVAQLADEQRHLHGELFYEDDETQSVRRDSDVAILKPFGECFLAGHCHAPGGRPALSVGCGFSVGGVKRSFVVHGDRYWNKGIFENSFTKAEPFAKMPLRWERSFGGPGFAANPLGRGIAPVAHSEGPRVPLPNIEHAEQRIETQTARPAPAGAFPLPRTWAARTRFQGTYGGEYLATRWPYFPEDFSWEYFNAAPPEQRIERYWRGDEEVTLQHMHPAIAGVRTKLPGDKPRLFLLQKRDAKSTFDEVRLALDTITVDADAWQIECVWRGIAEVDDEQLSQQEALFVALDGAKNARQVSELRAVFERVRREQESPSEFATELPPTGGDAPVERENVAAAAVEAAREKVTRAALEREEARLDAQLEDSMERVKNAKAPEVPAPLSLEELQRVAKEIGLELDPEIIAIFRDAPNEPPTAEPDAATEDPTVDLRADVSARFARGESLAGGDYTGADLSELDLAGADFAGAILAGAKLARAKLPGAVFDGAVLEKADFTAANLTGASFARADLAGTNFAAADLTKAKLSTAAGPGANFGDATLVECVARAADFSRSNFAHANARKADFTAADLTRSSLDRANFGGANLTEAVLNGVNAPKVVMDRANLTRARAGANAQFTEGLFREVQGKRSVWTGDVLDKADFSFSELSEADFGTASMRQTVLNGCALVGARFDDARVLRASLLRSDFYEANFTGADLSHSDARGSSFYAAQFYRAVTVETKFELADLTRTSLDGERAK